MPVFLDYRTAFVDDTGRLQLRADLYGYDRNRITVLPEKGLPPLVEPQAVPEAVVAPAPLLGAVPQATAMGDPAPL